ncbi:MAG: VOC family protein [Gammaproteobacteria bacterium]
MNARYTGIQHAAVLVEDTARALAFYTGVLGLTVDPARPDLGYPGAWLTVGDQQLHLMELHNPDPCEGRARHGGRDRHVALTVTDLAPVAEALAAAGVFFTRSRSGRSALFCRDPDGNALELVERPAGVA